MAALSRFDPFTSSIDDLFRGLLVRPTRLGLDLESMMGQQLQQLQMKLDVKKSDGAYEGRIERTFALDSEIDESKVEAKYEDGILKLHLPTKAASSAKRIAVS